MEVAKRFAKQHGSQPRALNRAGADKLIREGVVIVIVIALVLVLVLVSVGVVDICPNLNEAKHKIEQTYRKIDQKRRA